MSCQGLCVETVARPSADVGTLRVTFDIYPPRWWRSLYRIGNTATLLGHALYDDVRNSIYCDLCSIDGGCGGGGGGGGALNGLNGQGGSLAGGERDQWLYSRRDPVDLDQVLEEDTLGEVKEELVMLQQDCWLVLEVRLIYAGVVTSYPIYETIGWMDLELHLR